MRVPVTTPSYSQKGKYMIDKDYVCQDYGEVKDWNKIKATVKTEELDQLTSVMSMISNTLEIEDLSDIDMDTCYGTLIDESILNADKTHASVSVYLPAAQPLPEALSFLKERLSESGIEAEIEVSGVNEEDWANSWKQYYKPIHIGKKIVIVPAWETYDAHGGEIPIFMDPGMAFGTGSHETTRLVISLLEDFVGEGCSVLDVGTGSGILAICAAKLGARDVFGCDLDPVAVRVAQDNVAQAGLSDIVKIGRSDLLLGVDKKHGPYDIICANIVADILIRMVPQLDSFVDRNTKILCSGIVDIRSEDVKAAMNQGGYQLIRKETDNGWTALVFQKANKR